MTYRGYKIKPDDEVHGSYLPDVIASRLNIWDGRNYGDYSPERLGWSRYRVFSTSIFQELAFKK